MSTMTKLTVCLLMCAMMALTLGVPIGRNRGGRAHGRPLPARIPGKPVVGRKPGQPSLRGPPASRRVRRGDPGGQMPTGNDVFPGDQVKTVPPTLPFGGLDPYMYGGDSYMHGGGPDSYMDGGFGDAFYLHHFDCPEGWTKYDVRCLFFNSEPATWQNAEAFCRSPGDGLVAALPEIGTWDIDDLLEKADAKNRKIWVGGCTGEGLDMSALYWPSVNRNPVCAETTADGKFAGCLEEDQCVDQELPYICSMTIM